LKIIAMAIGWKGGIVCLVLLSMVRSQSLGLGSGTVRRTISVPLIEKNRIRGGWLSELGSGEGGEEREELSVIQNPSSVKTIPESWKRIPNQLTYLRCLLIPVFVVTFYSPMIDPLVALGKHSHLLSACIFGLASLTDYIDGYLARRWGVCSPFGAFLDPVADKLMVSTALVLLSGREGWTVALPTAVIVAREIAVSALREWMAQRGERESVKVGFQGKLKTAFTMVALTVCLIRVQGVGLALLWLAGLLTVTSGWVYFKAAAPLLLQSN